MKQNSTVYLTNAAIVAAAYATLTLLFAPISFGLVQFRVSEALTLLPFFFPFAVPGLFVGCLVSNLLAGNGIYDVVFGSLTTLVAAYLTMKCKNKWLAALPPVLLNAFVIGTMLFLLYFSKSVALPLCMVQVGFGQLVICYGLGMPLLAIIDKNKFTLGLENYKK